MNSSDVPAAPPRPPCPPRRSRASSDRPPVAIGLTVLPSYGNFKPNCPRNEQLRLITKERRLHARVSARNGRLGFAVRRRSSCQTTRIMSGTNALDEAANLCLAHGTAAPDYAHLLGSAALTV